MGLVNSPQTRVSIVVGVHAEAKGVVIPKGWRLPMGRIVTEAVHLLRKTLLFHPRLFVALSFLLPLPLEL